MKSLILFVYLFYETIWITDSQTTPLSAPSDVQKKILGELSWPVKLFFFKGVGHVTATEPARRVGIEEWKLSNRRMMGAPDYRRQMPAETDDANMKMKLFRLMYETVRDSDVKVKRAELIKSHYANDTAFEIGYLMGDITDKYNVMTDISMTLKRLYNEWKPIEHINAYEQIANQAIEINHIAEMMRQVARRGGKNETTNPDTRLFIFKK